MHPPLSVWSHHSLISQHYLIGYTSNTLSGVKATVGGTHLQTRLKQQILYVQSHITILYTEVTKHHDLMIYFYDKCKGIFLNPFHI